MVGIVDCGLGNLRSIVNALRHVGAECEICQAPERLDAASHVVLPGVGAFADGMAKLERGGWIDALERNVRGQGKPFLGICLGMQLMGERGHEPKATRGLGWIAGEVVSIPDQDGALRVPHIGWNEVRFERPDQGMWRGLGSEECFYFMHSFAFRHRNGGAFNGRVDYGVGLAASVEQDNLWAAQFHPEKSQSAGLAALRNFSRFKP